MINGAGTMVPFSMNLLYWSPISVPLATSSRKRADTNTRTNPYLAAIFLPNVLFPTPGPPIKKIMMALLCFKGLGSIRLYVGIMSVLFLSKQIPISTNTSLLSLWNFSFVMQHDTHGLNVLEDREHDSSFLLLTLLNRFKFFLRNSSVIRFLS